MPKISLPTPDWEPKLLDARLRYYQNFFSADQADAHYETLFKNIPWQQDNVKVFGKVYAQPRLTSLHSNTLSTYTYSGLTLRPHPMTKVLLEILNQIKTVCDHDFNCVLLNLYRDGSDSNGWHADNEKELGINPVIASVSFGEKRPFHFKHTSLKKERHKLTLEHGSLLLMKGEMQHYWLHQIAKTKKVIQPRINLTFRRLINV